MGRGVKNRTKQLVFVLLVALCISGLTIAISYLSIFQLLEWLTLDTWFRFRPLEAKESRLVLVTISESDINQLGQWPMSDRILSQLITKIARQQPRAIGLDIYRDLPIQPGATELEAVLRSTPNLIGIEKVIGDAVKPLPILKQQEQLASADLVRDADGKIRRGLLSVELSSGEVKLGLANRLALMYLAAENIEPPSFDPAGKLILGKIKLAPFQNNNGGYVGADDGGFQILINYRGTATSFSSISIIDVLNGKIPGDLMRDRIVLIGAIAPSLNDLFGTPYSDSRADQKKDLPGVLIHANIASQLISSALDGRSSIQTVREPWEYLWIFIWTFGVSISTSEIVFSNRKYRSPKGFISLGSIFLALVIPGLAILGSGYLLFLRGFWLPVISPLFSAIGSVILLNWSSQQNREQERTKLALTDGLTQISNRRCFDEFLAAQWWKSQEKPQNLSLILCDVDFFKKYNDTYGHQAGDLCLKQVAQVLAESVRNLDLAARYGGEEFVVVLPNTSPEIAMTIAQRCCDRLRALQIPHVNSQASEYVSLSCGIASTSVSSVNSPEKLIAAADRALYQAKEQGRDRAILWDGK
jgi:adenylate cyclase